MCNSTGRQDSTAARTKPPTSSSQQVSSSSVKPCPSPARTSAMHGFPQLQPNPPFRWQWPQMNATESSPCFNSTLAPYGATLHCTPWNWRMHSPRHRCFVKWLNALFEEGDMPVLETPAMRKVPLTYSASTAEEEAGGPASRISVFGEHSVVAQPWYGNGPTGDTISSYQDPYGECMHVQCGWTCEYRR